MPVSFFKLVVAFKRSPVTTSTPERINTSPKVVNSFNSSCKNRMAAAEENNGPLPRASG